MYNFNDRMLFFEQDCNLLVYTSSLLTLVGLNIRNKIIHSKYDPYGIRSFTPRIVSGVM